MVTTTTNIDGKDYHGQVNSLNCNLSNTSEVRRIASNVCMYNQHLSSGIGSRDKHSNIASIDMVTAARVISLTHYGITSYDEDIYLAHTNKVSHYHSNNFNETEPVHNGEDPLVFLEKESGK